MCVMAHSSMHKTKESVSVNSVSLESILFIALQKKARSKSRNIQTFTINIPFFTKAVYFVGQFPLAGTNLIGLQSLERNPSSVLCVAKRNPRTSQSTISV